MSEPVIGNFDCLLFQKIKARASSIFSDEVRKADYVADVEAAKLVLAGQTAKLDDLKNPTKDREITLTWMDDCDDADPVAVTDDCELGGTTLGTSCQDYALSTTFMKEFKVSEKKYRGLDGTMEEEIAMLMLKKQILMDNFWSKKVIAFLNANSGTNVLSTPYTVSGDVTEIPALNWTPNLMGYLTEAARKNRLNLTRFLSGSLLYQHFWQTEKEVSDPTGRSAMNKLGSFGTPTFDLFAMDDVLGYKGAFLFNPNSLALVTKYYNPSAPRQVHTSSGIQWRSSRPSDNLPGITYDWIVEQTCEDNDIIWKYRVQTKGDIFLNPLGCTPGRTGILQFKCV